jgi:hypothetical protein
VSSGLYCEFCYWEGRSKARPEGVGGERRRMGRATHPPLHPASNTHALLAVNLKAGRCRVKRLRDGIVTVLFLRQNSDLPVMTLDPGPSRQGNYNNRRGWAWCVERKGRQLAKVNQQPAACTIY